MLVVGDEILAGDIDDQNLQWFGRFLLGRGCALSRVHIVADCFEEIDRALQMELQAERPRLIVTTGGVGSSPDDVTYAAVAASLGLGLVDVPMMNRRIERSLDWMRDFGVTFDDEFTRHVLDKSRLPEGSRMLVRQGGWTPAVAIDVDSGCVQGGVTVVVTPGKPSEFSALVEHAIAPEFLADIAEPLVARNHEFWLPESLLSLELARLVAAHDQVAIGSYPGAPSVIRVRGRDRRTVEAASRDVDETIARVAAAPGGQALQRAWRQRKVAQGLDE